MNTSVMNNTELLSAKKNTMNEADRLAYLSEMQVSSWVLRKPFISQDLQVEVENIESFKKTQANVVVNKLVIKEEVSNQEIVDTSLINIVKNNQNETVKTVDDLAIKTDIIDSKTASSESLINPPNQFLNMINWNSVAYTERATAERKGSSQGEVVDKNILIVCRHKIDQPANSFANKRGPSHFMQDYLKVLVEFGLQNNLRLNIQLAHLSEAGLGEGSIKIDLFIKENQPDLTYILGDETVVNLIDKSSDVKSIRCRLNTLFDNTNAIVSYHPFDLISNPRLKSLAYEDIQFLINNLLQKI